MNKKENDQEVNELNDEQNQQQEKSTDEHGIENTEGLDTCANAEEKIKELEAKLAGEKDKWLRLYSEFDNAKKRHLRERADLLKTAGEDVFKLVLPVIDDFERAMKVNEKADDMNSVKEGFHLIYNKLKSGLSHKGLEEIKCMGEPFNSDFMEAIANIPAPEEGLKGKVVDVTEKGYTLNGKVIRFAKVVVGN